MPPFSLGARPSMSFVGAINLGEFVASVNAFKVKTLKQADQVARKAILDVFRKVVMRTPVDTGRCRAGWTIGQVYSASSELFKSKGKHYRYKERRIKSRAFQNKATPIPKWNYATSEFIQGGAGTFDKSGGTAISKGSAVLSGISFFDTKGWGRGVAYIYNNVHYAIYLEFGHSKQAPSGMVRVTLSEWTAIVNGAASAWSA